jgi:hypothetical protein
VPSPQHGLAGPGVASPTSGGADTTGATGATTSGAGTDGRSASATSPAAIAATRGPADLSTRHETRSAAADSRPPPLAEIVPTAAEWSDARRQASSARVAPLSLTQTLAGGSKVARVADCVPTTFAPDARHPGQVGIGHTNGDLVRSVSSTQAVGRVLARTRFDGADLSVPQTMCLPPDLAGQLAQLPLAGVQAASHRLVPPRGSWAGKAGTSTRAGKSRVEPPSGATG